ncbi:beta-1,3-galactosyltransferase 6-like [Macrobrachium rosenbergii]|uniref:beta-1,3-galactosyltransferase 6-like n=1 Tax=Macrobrachium rosenbergii TaxID=79674 RepID=UPI0034D3FDE5
MMRRASGFSACRRPLRTLLYVVSCIGAFMCGSLMTLMSVDPMSCDIHRCTEKIKRTDVEDTNSWLGMWGQNVKGPEKHVFLVIVILSAPNNVEQRDVIRQTWLSEEKSDTLHFFVVGTENLNESINTTIQSEQKRFGDMMLLTNVIDSYEALTKKLLAAFVYVHFNVKFRFFMKCDDDTFVQIPQLHRELKSVPYKQRLYWGFFDGRATPKKKGPWKEAEWVLCDRYLPYALGGGYVLSSDVVTFIATNSKYLKLYKNEDVSLGTWVAPLDLHRVHDTRFDTEYKSRGCNNDYLVTHKQSTLHMREKFTSIKSTSLLCREQFQVRKSYNYNWNVPPSQCCIRNDSSLP